MVEEGFGGVGTWGLDQFPRAVLTKSHRPGSFKQQKRIVSQIWRPEVQDEGVGRAAALPASGGAISPWHVFPASASDVAQQRLPPVSVSSPRLGKLPLVSDPGSILLQYGLTLISYIYNDPIS